MKKKIVIILPHLNIRGGGAPKVGSSLNLGLIDDYNFFIITFYDSKEKYPYRGKYYTLNLKKYHFGLLFKVNQLQKIIKSISPDIIISFMNLTSFWIIPIMYLYKIKVPLILSVNSNPVFEYRKRYYYNILIRILYSLKRLAAIVPVSEELKSIFTDKYKISKSKILPIYNGIDIEKVLELSKEGFDEYKIIFDDPSFFKFIAVGRISAEKGYTYLIEAFYKVIQQIPKSYLIIIGDGKARHQIESLIKKRKLDNKVILMGYQNNPYKYLIKSDILVLSSLNEGLPYSLVEALVCKLPIISTDCPTGPSELLEGGKYGILAKVADHEDLASKMIYLAKNKDLREKFSKDSHKRINAFDQRTFIKKWKSLIEYCLNYF